MLESANKLLARGERVRRGRILSVSFNALRFYNSWETHGGPMPSAVEQLTRLMTDPDPYRVPPGDIHALQVRALEECLRERRQQIRVLDRRAREEGIESIRSPEDLVPLLFAHTTYKSYPESLLEKQRWDRLVLWLDALSTQRVENEKLDLDGVDDVDEFLARLHRAGHYVFCTSGTSGKCSFLNQTRRDLDVTRTVMVETVRWVTGFEPKQDRATFVLGPHKSPTRYGQLFDGVVEAYGRPDARHYLFDQPLRMADLNRMGVLRRRMAEGTATPGEIEAAEEEGRARQGRMEQRLTAVVDDILARRAEPMVLQGLWAQFWSIVETARKRGIRDGEFHPEIAMFVGGGLKGVSLPEDYREQIQRFFGVDGRNLIDVYGMQEMAAGFPRCSAGRYHRPPWVVLFVLDREGERLLNPAEGRGEVDGRMAFFDLSIDGRWGGLISGDRVTVDFSPCPCGRPSPTVRDVVRYMDLPEGDDKLTCSATVESYVRGMITT